MRLYGSADFDPDELLRDLDNPERFWFASVTLGGLLSQLSRRHRRELWARFQRFVIEGDTWTKSCLLGILERNAHLVPSRDHAVLGALILRISKDEDPGLRRDATGCLSTLWSLRTEPDRSLVFNRLVEMTKDENPDVRRFATGHLPVRSAGRGSGTVPGVIDHLVAILSDSDTNVRISAIDVLGEIGLTTPEDVEVARVVGILLSSMPDPEPRVRATVLQRLASLAWRNRLGRYIPTHRQSNFHRSLVAAIGDAEPPVYWSATVLLTRLAGLLPTDVAAEISVTLIDRLRTGMGGLLTIEAIAGLREGIPRNRIPEISELLLGLTQSPDLGTAREAAFALTSLRDLLPPMERRRAKATILTNQERLRVGWFD